MASIREVFEDSEDAQKLLVLEMFTFIFECLVNNLLALAESGDGDLYIFIDNEKEEERENVADMYNQICQHLVWHET